MAESFHQHHCALAIDRETQRQNSQAEQSTLIAGASCASHERTEATALLNSDIFIVQFDTNMFVVGQSICWLVDLPDRA